MKQVCRLLCSEDKLEDYTKEDEKTLKDDLEWLLKAGNIIKSLFIYRLTHYFYKHIAFSLSQYVQEDHDLFIEFLEVINWVGL
jgi:hypothetical protein